MTFSLQTHFCLAGFVALACCATGCDGSEGVEGESGSPTQNNPECGPSDRYADYAPGMSFLGVAGYRIVLDSATPAPPAKHNNLWELSIVDAVGAPVDGLALNVVPFMPDHNHASAVDPVVMPLGGGQYRVDAINFIMGGVWETSVELADAAGTVLDTVQVPMCIKD